MSKNTKAGETWCIKAKGKKGVFVYYIGQEWVLTTDEAEKYDEISAFYKMKELFKKKLFDTLWAVDISKISPKKKYVINKDIPLEDSPLTRIHQPLKFALLELKEAVGNFELAKSVSNINDGDSVVIATHELMLLKRYKVNELAGFYNEAVERGREDQEEGGDVPVEDEPYLKIYPVIFESGK